MSGSGVEQSARETAALAEAVVAGGFRLTPARRVVIECLVDSGGHISADDLAARVRDAAPQVGRMTVFRTLEMLNELGLVRPIYQGTGAAHYVLMSEGSHHHLICRHCHRVIDFDTCGAGELAKRLGEEFGFEVQSHMLEVYGVCGDCRG
ncbi:MAG: transcriptional repressor [Caldilineales bacterium]|nr:transcriptional repressor [Caldilineales bacterium]